MAGGDDGDFGAFEGTHTAPIAPDPERAAKVGATRATVEAAMGDLVASVASPGEAEQPSLMLDEIDEQLALFAGPVKHVAETIGEARRARGRPKGSTNKNGFGDVLLRMGYRHPGLNLAAIANADPVKLALELAAREPDVFGERVQRMELTRAELSGLVERAYAMIMKANAELLPYFVSKAPVEIAVSKQVLGVMVIGDMPTQQVADDAVLDLTNVRSPDE